MKKFSRYFLSFIFTVVLSATLDGVLPDYYQTILIYIGINAILTLSLNIINGMTGQFSIGHAGFMAIGAYVSAYLSRDFFGHGVFFLPALLAGGLSASIGAFGIGLLTFRLRGDYLAIVTLGFSEIIRVLLLNMDLVGGARGFPGIPKYTSLTWVYSALCCIVFFFTHLFHSKLGRSFLAIREDELAAEVLGFNTTYVKLKAFIWSAFFAGIGGGFFAHQLTYLNPQSFDFNRSFEILIMLTLGGQGSVSGSIFAAGLLTVLKEALRPINEWLNIDIRMIFYALILIILMLKKPEGLFGKHELPYFLKKLRRSSK